jgi:hypothetical protein
MNGLEQLTRRAFMKSAAVLTGVSTAPLLCSGAQAPAQSGHAPEAVVKLGVGASLGGKKVFPADNPWNEDISDKPVDPNSETLIRSIGIGKSLHADFRKESVNGSAGIPYVVVPGTQPKVPVSFEDADESDRGPYPIPPDAPIEGGAASDGDRHVLVIDRDNWKLYELFAARPGEKGWHAGSGAIFNLNSNRLRTLG